MTDPSRRPSRPSFWSRSDSNDEQPPTAHHTEEGESPRNVFPQRPVPESDEYWPEQTPDDDPALDPRLTSRSRDEQPQPRMDPETRQRFRNPDEPRRLSDRWSSRGKNATTSPSGVNPGSTPPGGFGQPPPPVRPGSTPPGGFGIEEPTAPSPIVWRDATPARGFSPDPVRREPTPARGFPIEEPTAGSPIIRREEDEGWQGHRPVHEHDDMRAHDDVTASSSTDLVVASGDNFSDPTMPPPSPKRLFTVASAVIAVVVAPLIMIGSQSSLWIFAAGVFVLQAILVTSYVVVRQSPGKYQAIGVGIAASAGADVVSVMTPDPFTFDYLVYVIAGAFILTIVTQLFRRGERDALTDAMSSSVVIAVVAVGMSMLIGLTRQGGGSEALWVGVIAVAGGVAAARVVDLFLPNPRINRQVPRGAFGIVIGGMVAIAMAAYAGVLLEGPSPQKAALGGLVIGLVGVLGDLVVGYIHAGRRIDRLGEAPWMLRVLLGPLMAFAVSAPVLYLMSVFYIVRGI